MVKISIEEEVTLDKEKEYPKVLVESKSLFAKSIFMLFHLNVNNTAGAIQRYFESRRRNWRELTDPSQQQRVKKQARNRRIRSRRLRVSEFIYL